MIKNFVVTILCCLMTTGAMAQKMRIGVKAGVNMNTTVPPRPLFDGTKENTFHPGFTIGGSLFFPLSRSLQLEVDLLYSMKSNKSHMESLTAPPGSITPYSFDYVVKRHYICFPALIKYYPTADVYIECGPELGYRVGLNYSACETVESIYNNKIDFGILCGVGYDINEHLYVNARYTHGLVNTYSEKYPIEKDSEKNRCINIFVGYRF